MSKKMMWAIVAIVVVVLVAVAVYFIFFAGGKSANVDITAVSSAIAEKAPFNEMASMDIDSQVLNSLFDIEEDQIEEVKGKMPMMNVHASMYVLIKAKEGKVNEVKEKVEAYGTAYEEQWSTYLPEQHELVKNRKIGVKGNTVYMIIAENAQELEKLVK